MTRSLGVLKDNAALLNIEIAGEERIPQTLVDVLGSYLTQTTGGQSHFQDKNAFLSGGYDCSQIAEKNLNKNAKAWKNLEMFLSRIKVFLLKGRDFGISSILPKR